MPTDPATLLHDALPANPDLDGPIGVPSDALRQVLAELAQRRSVTVTYKPAEDGGYVSGGSYGYLEGPVSAGLFDDAIDRTHLAEMLERLDGLPWAAHAARDVRFIIERAQSLDDELKRLVDVFHAIEWWDSCDWSEGQARTDVEAYKSVPGTHTTPQPPETPPAANGGALTAPEDDE
jgi:hypothetical protein